MSWTIAHVGGHAVYAQAPSTVLVEGGVVTFHGRRWAPGIPGVITTGLDGECVEVYVPFGALTGVPTDAVVRRESGAVERWPRLD